MKFYVSIENPNDGLGHEEIVEADWSDVAAEEWVDDNHAYLEYPDNTFVWVWGEEQTYLDAVKYEVFSEASYAHTAYQAKP